MYLSDKFNYIKPSGTVAFTSLLQKLRQEGQDVIDLAVGEPDFAVDHTIITATAQALNEGHTRYGPVAGLPALKKRLAAEFNGYGPNNIIISNGAKQGLYQIFQAICDPGREVIVPAPCWVSFEHQIKLAGGSPVLVQTVQHQLDVEALARAVTDRTVAILINSPNNPTRAVYNHTMIARVVDLCLQNDLWLISDEAYASFVYRPQVLVSPFEFPEIRSRLMVVRSFSKTYAMTGYRVGYVAASEEMIARMTTLQGHISGNICTFAQYGALSAQDQSPEILKKRRILFEERRDLAVALCNKIFDLIAPAGAFYLFPDINRYLDRFEDDQDFARYLLENANVAVIPGAFFGAPGHVRISFAASTERLIQGFARIEDVL